jgi:acyl-CoA reductase-like NAD-dependent aldehyde dehydrogenase
MGRLITAEHRDRVARYVDQGEQAAAVVDGRTADAPPTASSSAPPGGSSSEWRWGWWA